MEFWFIDRWEGDIAVCLNEQDRQKVIPREQFPPQAREGDWFFFTKQGSIQISSEETKMRQNTAQNQRKRLLLR